MAEIDEKGPGSSGREFAADQRRSVDGPGVRRRYSPPRVLSGEVLELAASGCDAGGTYGKIFPACKELGT